MLFTSISFIYYFLPIVLLIYFISPKKFKNLVLLISSLIFYFLGDSKYLILMLFEVIICYVGSLILENHHSKKVLAFFLTICFGLLGYFKYTKLFIETINQIFRGNINIPNIVLPIGISFYTFQIISYLIDTYKHKITPTKNILDLATYITLFPQLIAGPIVRYEDINKNLKEKDISLNNFSKGVSRFVFGLAKKVIIANTLGQFCNIYLNCPDKTIVFSLFYAISYMLQVFYDFSGYSDMAIGLGLMLGFHFPENFNYPFIAGSITDFWRRWHISLGSWFRDYIYIPLGGSRVGTKKLIINILIVWSLTGLWHGAAWNFVIWGLYFGILLLLEKIIFKKYFNNVPKFIKHLYVLINIMISFVIFGATSISEAFNVLKNMFGFNNLPLVNEVTSHYLLSFGFFIVIGIIFATPLIKNIIKKIKKYKIGYYIVNLLEPLVLICLLLIVTSYLIDNSYNPFLYFRF